MTRGLSKTEKEIRAAKYGLASANDLIVYGAAPGAMEAHDFSKGLDIKSLKGGKVAKKPKSIKTLKESVMSVGETTLGSDEEESESNEEEDDELGGKSVYVNPQILTP